MRRTLILICGAMLFWTSCSDDEVVSSGSVGPEVPEEEYPAVTTFDTRGMIVSYDPAHGELGALVSWKWMKDDPNDAAYDIYRSVNGGEFQKLNSQPITKSTNYKDLSVDVSKKIGRAHV